MQAYRPQPSSPAQTTSISSSDSMSIQNTMNDQFNASVLNAGMSNSTQSDNTWNNNDMTIPMDNNVTLSNTRELSSIPMNYNDDSMNKRSSYAVSELEHKIYLMENDMQRLLLENEKLKNQVHSLESILEEQMYKNKMNPTETSMNSNNLTSSDCGKHKVGRYWSIEEHGKFVEALEKFGTRDIKTISAYVGTRTATQVRTHLQKFLLRLKNENNKHRKESIYNLSTDSDSENNNNGNSTLNNDILIPVVGSSCNTTSMDMDLNINPIGMNQDHSQMKPKDMMFEDRQKNTTDSCLSISLPNLSTNPSDSSDGMNDMFKPAKQYINYDMDAHKSFGLNSSKLFASSNYENNNTNNNNISSYGVSSSVYNPYAANNQQHYYYHPNQYVDTSILRKVYSIPSSNTCNNSTNNTYMNSSSNNNMNMNISSAKPVFPVLPQNQQLNC